MKDVTGPRDSDNDQKDGLLLSLERSDPSMPSEKLLFTVGDGLEISFLSLSLMAVPSTSLTVHCIDNKIVEIKYVSQECCLPFNSTVDSNKERRIEELPLKRLQGSYPNFHRDLTFIAWLVVKEFLINLGK